MLWNRVSFKHQNINKQIKWLKHNNRHLKQDVYDNKRKDSYAYVYVYV